VNGDGRQDIITARGRKPVFGAAQGELRWLEQPADPTAVPWPSHKLADGPDIGIDVLAGPSGSGHAWIFAAEFFGKRFSFFELRSGAIARSGVIDATEGEMYSVRALAGSTAGSVSLFATNYRYSGAGSVFLYSGLLGATLNRTIVASGFHNRQFAPGSGAPGWLFPHWPTTGSNAGPASLFVCGDGSETLTLLSPNGSGRWAQTFQEDYSSTVGSAALGDFDSDGYTDVVVTDYNKGLVHAYTYSPK
jgi:hypothetical protein